MNNNDKKMIYLDNSATTEAYPEVRDIVVQTLSEDFGNPSSMHVMGVDSEKYIKKAASDIASSLKVKDKEIYFTSGGTESNNWAIRGAAYALKRRGNRIITSTMEHPSVSAVFDDLEKEGFEVIRIGLKDAALDMEALDAALDENTILVSIMLVNNEVGIKTDPYEIGKMIKAKSKLAVYHADAVQAYGKINIEPKASGIDLLSVSAHKIHGPKGVGFLYKSENVLIKPLILGGGQQDALRSGTYNVPGIAGLGEAARIVSERLDENAKKMSELRDGLIKGFASLDDVVIHGDFDREGLMAPHIVNASFIGVGSEVLLHSLEDYGICVSAGSACSTHKKAKSPTLESLGASDAELNSALRFSFSEGNTLEEVDITIDALKTLLPMLRRYRAH